MSVLLRYEVDACLPSAIPPTNVKSKELEDPTEDDLVNALASLSVTGQTYKGHSADRLHDDVDVMRGGVEIPQSSLIKIKSRSARNVSKFDWTAAYIQLFLGQTPNLFIGIHRAGMFYDVQKSTMESAEMKVASETAQPALKKLRTLLEDIVFIALRHNTTGRLSLICKDEQLMIYERKSQSSFLPEEILDRFDSF